MDAIFVDVVDNQISPKLAAIRSNVSLYNFTISQYTNRTTIAVAGGGGGGGGGAGAVGAGVGCFFSSFKNSSLGFNSCFAPFNIGVFKSAISSADKFLTSVFFKLSIFLLIFIQNYRK